MKFLVQLEIFCFAVNFQLVKSQLPLDRNGTIYIQHGNGTVMQEQPKHSDHSEPNQHKSTQPEKSDVPGTTDHYTFVAIIEIMFNDGSRKHCTGAIIHDNVVITAAHCFENELLNTLEPELTGSFVIIGTKEMFDTGYEQYLPIERVLTHPDYKGWNADLALVYTFAGMMSDKPGEIIPLAEENSYTTLYANVTVLNWNQIKKKISLIDISCPQSSGESGDKDIYFEKEVTRPMLSSGKWSKEVTKESALILEDYTIFETDACKRLVQKLQPAIYQIESVNKTLCYFTKHPNKVQPLPGRLCKRAGESEDKLNVFFINYLANRLYIRLSRESSSSLPPYKDMKECSQIAVSKANSGAPAVNRNHLVAIAAGDLDNDAEHIIVATKLNCYCMWISENLPGVGEKLQCCTDCCPEASFKSKQEVYF